MTSGELSEMFMQGPMLVVSAGSGVYIASYLMAVGVALWHPDPIRRADAQKVLEHNPLGRLGRGR